MCMSTRQIWEAIKILAFLEEIFTAIASVLKQQQQQPASAGIEDCYQDNGEVIKLRIPGICAYT